MEYARWVWSEVERMRRSVADSAFHAQAAKIFLVVSSYWIISISMVFLNKYLLSSPELKLDAPLFITWFQCVVAVVCCYILGEGRKHHKSLEMFPPFSVSLETCLKCLPLSAVFVGMIAFNNLCLKEIGVSFYNVGRSLTTIFNVLLSYFILGEMTSFKAVSWCAVLISGFFLGVDQEGDVGDLSWQGIIFGVLASLFVALNSIYVKRVLPFVENDSWRLLLYNNLNAVLLFLPLMLMSGEFVTVFQFERISSPYFWTMMTLSGFFGIAIGIVTTLQIQHTSPLTHNISGTAKACAQTVIAVFVNDEVKTGLWWLSNFLVLVASAGYTHTRGVEMRLAQAAREKEKQVQAELEREAELQRVLESKQDANGIGPGVMIGVDVDDGEDIGTRHLHHHHRVDIAEDISKPKGLKGEE